MIHVMGVKVVQYLCMYSFTALHRSVLQVNYSVEVFQIGKGLVVVVTGMNCRAFSEPSSRSCLHKMFDALTICIAVADITLGKPRASKNRRKMKTERTITSGNERIVKTK